MRLRAAHRVASSEPTSRARDSAALAARSTTADVERALHYAIRWEDETDGADSLLLWKHMIEAG